MVGKKHVLFIVENNSVPCDRRVWAEALAVKSFGYDVSVICPEDKKRKQSNDEVLEGIQIYRHPRSHEGKGKLGLISEYINALFWEFLFSFRVYIKKRFHVIHGANPPDHIFLIALPFKLLGVSYIFDHHDIAPENYVAKFGKRGALCSILHLMERVTFLVANLVISTNESYRQIAISRGGRKSDDVFIVRNGPDIRIIPDIQENPALRKGFKYLLGYVGVIGQQEGIENLLQTMQYIVNTKNRTDIKCIVVGTGPHWDAIVALAKGMNVDKYIEFTGFIPDEEMYEVLRSADICINPEFGNEFTDKSTMIKIMEYMAFARPIIQYHTTEGEYSAGEAAVYVRKNDPEEFANEILLLLDNPDKRKIMGERGRKRIEEKLCWEKQIVNLHQVYNKTFKLR